MSTWAIVPVKPLKRAKSRLAPIFSLAEREAFSLQLLNHTLDALAQVSEIDKVLVVSRDTAVLKVAREHNAKTITESGAPELNATLTRAANLAASFGAEAILVVSTDLPLVSPMELRHLLTTANGATEAVTLAPDRHDESTNAIYLRPPTLLPFVFGATSFAQYQKLAQAHGLTAYVYRATGLTLDVDTPEDLELYRESMQEVDR
jgi:2-phospho-L-lactate guanylyltransferase